jgi:hypothetical protein
MGTHVVVENTCSSTRAVTYKPYLRVGLGEAEDVVNEEQHVLALLVTEVLGNGKTSQRNARASTC